MNILLVTTRLFDRPRSGGEIGTARLIATLTGLGHRLHVVGRGVAPAPSSDIACDGVVAWTSLGPIEPAFDDLTLWQRTKRLLSSLASGQASTVHRSASGGTAERLREALLHFRAWSAATDVLVIDHLQAWSHVAALQAGLPAPVLLMHNVEPDVYAEQARQAGHGPLVRAVLRREARLLQRFENRVLRAASVVACLSEQDALRFQAANERCGAAAPVITLPPYPLGVASLERPPQLAPRRQVTRSRRRIGMLGTWTWGPNRQGLQWIVEEVLPRLPAQCELVLAGTGLDRRRWFGDRIRWLGAVDDIGTFYGSVDAVAIAAFNGSGVQEKAVEAIVHARAVVATRHAVRGLDSGMPRHVRVTDEPAEFARLCAEEVPRDLVEHAASVRRWAEQRTADYKRGMVRCLELARCATPPIATTAAAFGRRAPPGIRIAPD